jgi:maltose O-acetyltransferase
MRHPRDLWDNGRAVARAQWHLRSADAARTVRIFGRPRVANYGRMVIGDRALLMSHVATLELATGRDGTLEIGERTFINYGGSISADLLVRIGPQCQIGTHVIMMDNDFHRLEPERRLERPESAPIILGENVWLGARVIVTKGVTIGDGSVVGAGSVVTRDLPPRVLAAGAPAKVIRSI